MDELVYKLWFHGINISNSSKIKIMMENISVYEFWNFNIKNYIELGINIIKSQEIEKSKELEEYYKISEYLTKNKINFILYNDMEFPERLRNIFNPPDGIFIKGKLPDVTNSLGIVGSRKASQYGKTVAYKLSYELSKYGVIIVSGLARGIDSCAHRGCLDGEGRTVAIMGSGFQHVYPSENIELFNQISEQGCVITEYMPDTRPYASNFPERNRLISGLSQYVLVVEAGEKSGSLITASLALEQGKDVFAVPGNIYSSSSQGTNNLIKDGAKLISSIEDILEEFNLKNSSIPIINGSENYSKILKALKIGGMTMEDILLNTGLGIDELLPDLSRLECQGVIKRTYGNYYIIC